MPWARTSQLKARDFTLDTRTLLDQDRGSCWRRMSGIKLMEDRWYKTCVHRVDWTVAGLVVERLIEIWGLDVYVERLTNELLTWNRKEVLSKNNIANYCNKITTKEFFYLRQVCWLFVVKAPFCFSPFAININGCLCCHFSSKWKWWGRWNRLEEDFHVSPIIMKLWALGICPTKSFLTLSDSLPWLF